MMTYNEMIGPEQQFKRYKSFRGPNHKQMQQLLTGIIKSEEGISVDIPRWPLSSKQLMELRLGRSGAREDIIEARHNYIHTTTAVLPNPNGSGEFKFVNQYPLIYTLNPETEMTDGGSRITQTQYDNSDGFTVTARWAKEFRVRYFAFPDIRRELVHYLAEEDSKLAQAYIEDIESVPNLDLGERCWHSDHEGFGLKVNENALSLIPPQNDGMRLLLMGAYGDYTRSGGLVCDEHLTNSYFGYLIGKAAWSESSSEKDDGKKSLTERIRNLLKIKKE